MLSANHDSFLYLKSLNCNILADITMWCFSVNCAMTNAIRFDASQESSRPESPEKPDICSQNNTVY